MPEHLYYILVDAGVIAIPFLASFHPRLRFSRHFKAFFPACILSLIPFILWDIRFTQLGVWGFNERYLSGVSLAGLPIEEWLFFICIPFSCVFVYHCIGLLKFASHQRIGHSVLRAGSVVLIVLGLVFWTRAYTASTFLGLGLFLGLLSWVRKAQWLPRAVVSYLAVLPFFFLSNGILTGSWIPEEIVWYHDAENLGIRLGTIPAEDIFYGMLLIVLNCAWYEFFRQRAGRSA